jgi:tryptophan 2,3-dioxygenase
MPRSYGEYLKVPELLSLQQLLSSPTEHDETLFIVVHQVYELWFKEILHELDTASRRLDGDDVLEASRLLRRVVEIQRVLIAQVRVLETMRPQDFLGFRYHLNPASGFQSVQFREVEFMLGLKDAAVIAHLSSAPEETERLRRRLEAPGVGQAFDGLLVRRGFPRDGAPPPASAPSAPEDWRLQALLRVYEEGDRYGDLLALCEVLIEIDEGLALWRAHHVQMVERTIGAKRGTGGSDGVGYLRSTLSKRAFPDLWRVRTHLGQEPA